MKKNTVLTLVGMFLFLYSNVMASKYEGGVNADCNRGFCEGDIIVHKEDGKEIPFVVDRVFLSGNVQATPLHESDNLLKKMIGLSSKTISIDEIIAFAKKECGNCKNKVYSPYFQFSFNREEVKKIAPEMYTREAFVFARLSDGRYVVSLQDYLGAGSYDTTAEHIGIVDDLPSSHEAQPGL